MQRRVFFMVLAVAALIVVGLFAVNRPASFSGDPAEGAHFAMGDPDAPVTVVEFANYLCPHCRTHALEVLPHILRDYVETGKVRYVFRDFPFKGAPTYRPVVRAGEAAACAADQGRYLEYHTLLFRAQGQWGRYRGEALDRLFIDYASQIGLDREAFAACLASGEKERLVLEDLKAAEALNLNSTPSFFIGGELHRGVLSYEEWQRLLDGLLAGE